MANEKDKGKEQKPKGTDPKQPINAPPPTNSRPLPTQPTTAPTSSNDVRAMPLGWQHTPGKPGTLAEASKIINSRTYDTSKIYSGPVHPEFAGYPEGAPSIVEQARALKNDPQLIFEFVYDNIDWQPGWGLMKGPLGSLLDQGGAAWDQCSLLVALLTQAGYTAEFVLGQIKLTTAQFDAWFGTDSLINSYCCYYYAQNANIPCDTPTETGGVWSMIMAHVWVQVVVGENTYVLDPSYKTYTRTSPISDLGTIMDYTQSGFLTDAESGATVDGSGNFVQNMNAMNIATDLKNYTANLVSYINDNTVGAAPPGTAGVDDILGGKAIVPITLPFTWLTSLPYEYSISDTWSSVPTAYQTTLHVQYLETSPGVFAIDQTFTSDQLAGGRLTLTFNTGLYPVLTLNGTVVQTSTTAQGEGTWNSAYLTVTHNAYTYTFLPWWQQFIYAGQYYLIGNSWGNLGGGQASFHQTQLAAALAYPYSTSEAINGEWMSCIWFNWASQASRVGDLAGRINNTYTNPFHAVGMVSLYFTDGVPTPGTDIGGVAGYTATLDYDFTQLPIFNTVNDMHGVALEAATLAQFNGVTPSVSTTTTIDKTNRTAAITVGGTITTGDVLTITVHDPVLSGGMQSVPYTVSSSVTTLIEIAEGISNALNGALSSFGITSTATGGPVVLVASTTGNQTYYTESTSVGATETIMIAFSKIYLANSSNWTSGIDIENILTTNGVESSTISSIGSAVSGGAASAMIGDQPYYGLGAWYGEGWWILYNYSNNGDAIGLISDTGKGGSGGQGAGKTQTNANQGNNSNSNTGVGDPINPFTGDFFYNRTDFSVGSQPFPYSLSFERQYNSANQYVSGPLSWGWTHNHAITATIGSDGLLAMGDQFAMQAAATIVELYIAMDLAADSTQPITKLVTMSLADKWWIDQIVNNTVVVAFGNINQIFVKQPNGTYTAPSAFPSTLALASGLYTLTTPQRIKYEFNSSGQIASWVSPAGVTITYTYSSGILQNISNGMGRELVFGYYEGRMSSVSDGTDRHVEIYYYNDYDIRYDLQYILDTTDSIFPYTYDQPGRMTYYTLPANPETPFTTNVYDSLSRVKTQANARSQVFTCYLAGSRTEIDDPLGNVQVFYFNNQGAITRSINALNQETDSVFDGLNRLIQTTLPEGNKTLLTYDDNNNILSVTFVPKPGSGLSDVGYSYTYNTTWAKVYQITDANSNVTTCSYDPTLGNLTSIVGPSVTGGTPQVVMTYNARGQMITKAINTTNDTTAIVTQLNYDTTTEKLTSAIFDYSSGSGHLNLTVLLGYDSVGNCTDFTDPNSNQTTYVFDTERRMTQMTAPTPFSYISNFGYDLNSNLTSIANQLNGAFFQTTTYAYTVTNKLYTITDPLLHMTTAAYDGADRLQSVTDAQSREYQYSYDQLNRIYSVTDPTDTIRDTRTYTNNGYLETIKDSSSNVTQFAFDGLDRLSVTTFADMTTQENSSYDSNGNVLTYIPRYGSGYPTTLTYDALNRLATKSPYGQAEITYSYDLSSRLVELNKAGSGDPSCGNFQFFYDTAGRFYQEEYPDSKTVTHVLDSNGNRTKTTWPDGYYVTRSFDQLNRLTNIYLNGSSTSAAAFGYDQLSRRTSLTLGNGAVVDYAYALNNDLTELTNTFVGVYQRYDYDYNNVHQIVGTTMADASYMWEPSSSISTAYGTADDVNKYPTVGSATFTYDGNKNLTYDGTYTYSYDIENHLLSVSESGTAISSYVYDPLQRQAQKTVGSISTRFIYSGFLQIADYNGSTLNNRYIFADFDEPIIQVTGSGAVSYIHRDQQNTIVAITNNSGAVSSKYTYSPFGESLALSGTTFGYTGQRYDAETGLYYYKARYFLPTIGRFLQPDPIGYLAGTLNLYAYVNNDPLQFLDPLGLQATQSTGTGPDSGSGPGPGTGTGSGTGQGTSTGTGNGGIVVPITPPPGGWITEPPLFPPPNTPFPNNWPPVTVPIPVIQEPEPPEFPTEEFKDFVDHTTDQQKILNDITAGTVPPPPASRGGGATGGVIIPGGFFGGGVPGGGMPGGGRR